MGRSNTANGGNTFIDFVFQLVSADESQYTLRIVAYLTSLNVTDSSNDFSVSNPGGGRSGAFSLNGVYNATPIWFQDVSHGRWLNQARQIDASMSFSGVNYWGVTLTASASYVIPAATAAPSPPTAAVRNITATSANVYVAVAGAENGLTADYCNYRIHRVSDGAHMGDIGGPGYGYGGATFTNLARATAYNAYAQTHNAKGYGGFSGPVGFTTASSVPDPPALPVASAITPTSFTVTWAAPANGGSALTGYQLQVDNDASFASPVLDTAVSAATLNRSVTGLSGNTQYRARVRAQNGNGYGAWSPVLTTTTGASGPFAPTGLTVVSAFASAANFVWTAAVPNGSPVTGYELEVDDNADFSSPVYTNVLGAATFGDTASPLASSTDHYWRVRATSALGPSAWATGTSFKTKPGQYMSLGSNNFTEGEFWMHVGGSFLPGELWMNVEGTWEVI